MAQCPLSGNIPSLKEEDVTVWPGGHKKTVSLGYHGTDVLITHTKYNCLHKTYTISSQSASQDGGREGS